MEAFCLAGAALGETESLEGAVAQVSVVVVVGGGSRAAVGQELEIVLFLHAGAALGREVDIVLFLYAGAALGEELQIALGRCSART